MLDVVSVFYFIFYKWIGNLSLVVLLDAVTCLKCRIMPGVYAKSALCEDNSVESELFKVFMLKVHDNHLLTCKKRQQMHT